MMFWDRINALLAIHRMTQTDLAKALNVTTSYISVSISRGTTPRGDFLIAASDYFGVTPHWLMTGEDKNAIDAKYALVINNKKIMEIGYLLTKCDTDFVELVGELVEHEISHQKTIW